VILEAHLKIRIGIILIYSFVRKQYASDKFKIKCDIEISKIRIA